MSAAAVLPNPSLQRARHPFATFISSFLVIFLVLFPKGGIKLGPVPLTWGYLFLGATLPILAVVRFLATPLRARRETLIAIVSLLPFQVLLIYSFAQFGISEMGFLASSATAFFALPFAFLVVYPSFLPLLDGQRLSRWFRFCVLAAALFGIVLFLYYPLTHKLIEIPYLTVNAQDYGRIVQTKHIDRGFFLKLISTYNNGNLYGAATLIILPLYCRLEPRRWKRLAIRLALILTLSRTVWLGLIVEQLLSLGRVGLAVAATFPRLVLGRTVKSALVVLGTVAAVFVGVLLTEGGKLSFLLDTGLGGRSGYFTELSNHISVLPYGQSPGFLEIVYITALLNYGILGLLSFLAIFLTPIALMLFSPAIRRSPLRMAACKGLIVYLIIAASDGGLLLIPVLAFYWFTYMVMLEGWPGQTDLIHPLHTAT